MSDVVVIGAGLSGLAAALRLREQGASVTLATFGLGGLPLSTGALDVLGYAPHRVDRPFEALDSVPEAHPYRTIGADAVRAGVDDLVRWCGPELLQAADGANHLVPTALGVLRPSAVVQPSMAADITTARHILVAGIRQFKDFHASLVAENLRRSLPGAEIRDVMVDFEARAGEADPSGLVIARALDDPAARARLATAIAPHLSGADLVVLPAVLGHIDHLAWKDLSERLGTHVIEVPCLPPSVPGIRLNDHLVRAVKKARVRWILGSRVTSGEFVDGRLASVQLATAGSPSTLRANAFVLATGGFESGALTLDSYGNLSETALDLPVWRPDGDLVHGHQLGRDMPLFRCGLRTDEHLRPVDTAGAVVADNLYATGGLLAGAVRWTEHSGDGIALGSARKATDHILEELA